MAILKVATCNVNGWRAAVRKGFMDWLAAESPDIVALQEVRASEDEVVKIAATIPDYQVHHVCAQKPGYSGVATLTRHQPSQVQDSLGHALTDEEGRYLRIDGDWGVLVNVYLPSGTSGDARQAKKMETLAYWQTQVLPALQAENRPVMIMGDFNIAHREIDLKNWRANRKNSGFLPEEREWVSAALASGWHDVLRHHCGDQPDLYTWWTYRAKAYDNNVGWRIDYQWVNAHWLESIRAVRIGREWRFSDHAPLVVEYDW